MLGSAIRELPRGECVLAAGGRADWDAPEGAKAKYSRRKQSEEGCTQTSPEEVSKRGRPGRKSTPDRKVVLPRTRFEIPLTKRTTTRGCSCSRTGGLRLGWVDQVDNRIAHRGRQNGRVDQRSAALYHSISIHKPRRDTARLPRCASSIQRVQ